MKLSKLFRAELARAQRERRQRQPRIIIALDVFTPMGRRAVTIKQRAK